MTQKEARPFRQAIIDPTRAEIRRLDKQAAAAAAHVRKWHPLVGEAGIKTVRENGQHAAWEAKFLRKAAGLTLFDPVVDEEAFQGLG